MLLDVTRAALPLCLVLLGPWFTGCASKPAKPRAERAQAEARFDVEHYTLDIAIDPVGRSVSGSCRIRLWPTNAELDSAELDLSGLRVDDVVDVSGRPLRFHHDGEELRVEFGAPIALGEPAEFTVRYSGRPVRGLYFTAERDGVPTQLYSHGECIDARAWFPCQDEPWDRATSELRVTVPRAWHVSAAGEQLERREQGTTATETWRTTFPHPAYLETLVAGEFAVERASWDGIPLTFAAAPRLASELSATFEATGDILAFFSTRTGVRYPYPKYAQNCVDGFQYGGMENVSATTLVDACVTDAAARADAPATGLIAHEAAHQWFGDLVTCANWSNAWLNEGFATYFTALYFEHAHGDDEFTIAMDDQRRSWLVRDAGANRRPMVYAAPGDPILNFFSGHVYEGGAVRLHHLRTLLGDAAFFRGVQLYLGENSGSGVVTDDLRRAMETASSRNLRSHFERWFRSHGHPRVEFVPRYSADRREIAIDVRQTQDDAPFPCLIEVEIADESGVRVERMELEGRFETFVLRQEVAPKWVRLDPRCALPAEILEWRTYDEWLALLARAPDAAGRRNAADYLGMRLREPMDGKLWELVTRSLTEAARADPSPLVRKRIAELLDPTHKSAANGTLQHLAADDPDPGVRAAAFRSLEARGADPSVAAIARREVQRNASYAAVASALGALVRAEPGDRFALLEAEWRTPSPHGERSARVLTEIARLGDPRALELMRTIALDETLFDAPRRVAIAELGRVAATDASARTALLSVLDSQRGNLRRDAIGALSKSVTPEVRARLERLARGAVDGRERAAIERLLQVGA